MAVRRQAAVVVGAPAAQATRGVGVTEHVYRCQNGHEVVTAAPPEEDRALVHRCDDCGQPATRVCGCPCREPLIGLSAQVKYVSVKHRQRAYRIRLKEARERAGLPGTLSLQAVQAYGGTGGRNDDGQAPARAPQKRRRTGVSVYFPTIETAEAVLAGVRIEQVTSPPVADRDVLAAAEQAIDKALERARKRKEAASS